MDFTFREVQQGTIIISDSIKKCPLITPIGEKRTLITFGLHYDESVVDLSHYPILDSFEKPRSDIQSQRLDVSNL